MDENGLPITGAGVNYASVEAINQRELITYFNMYLARTCTFLNTFAVTCESKLSNLHKRLETIDTNLVLLETKLNSVDELKDIKLDIKEQQQATTQNTTTATTVTAGVAPGSPPPPPPPPPAPPLPGQISSTSVPVPAPPLPPLVEAPSQPVMTVSQNPKYKKYFSMLKMGVPDAAVRIKMNTEGVDPDLLDAPDAPCPYEAEEESSSESDSD